MKKMLAIVMTFAVLFGIFSVAFAAENGAVDSVESVQEAPEGYTAIRTAEDLNNIRNALAGKYILMNDIDLSVYENWAPIGDAENPFTGELDGNGYAVKNLTINIKSDELSHIGLVGYSDTASILNVSFADAKFNVGAEESANVGVVVGFAAESIINNCEVGGEIITRINDIGNIGGIMGSGDSEISECFSTADITSYCQNYSSYVGGIAGNSRKTIRKSYNSGKIDVIVEDGNGIPFSGGIAGISYGEIENCYNTGSVESKGVKFVYAGGIAGISGSIMCCWNTGDILAVASNNENSFILSGGISGETMFAFDSIDNADADEEKDSYLINCYYLDEISQATSNPIDEAMINVKALSLNEFNMQSSFVGFNFENIWVMEESLGYPILKKPKNPEEITSIIAPTTTKTEDTTNINKPTEIFSFCDLCWLNRLIKNIINFIKNFINVWVC